MKPESNAPTFVVETFRGDLDDLHEMALSSWRDEYGLSSFPDLYRPEFVRYLVGEDVPPDHLVAAYDGDRCVGFVAFVPRTVVIHGRAHRACLAALLTVRKAYLRQGIAEAIVRSSLRLNEAYGYDLALFYLETGHRSSKLFAKLRAEGHRIEPLVRLSLRARILDLERVRTSAGFGRLEYAAARALRLGARPPDEAPEGLRPYGPEDLPDCLRLLDRHVGRADLARRYTEAELGRTLDCDPVARTLVVQRSGSVVALLGWVVHEHVGPRNERWAWISHVAWDDLGSQDRRRLVAAFLRRVSADGCVGVLGWNMRYHENGPLLRNRFFPYPRTVGMQAWLFDDGISPRDIRRVFELQV